MSVLVQLRHGRLVRAFYGKHGRGARATWVAATLLALDGVTLGQEKKEEKKKDPPRVVMALPVVVLPGATTKVKLRGLGLDQATAVRIADSKAVSKAVSKAEIKSKGKAELPKGVEASRAGDTQVEIELSLAADAPAGTIPIILDTPDGATNAHELLIMADGALTAEKEPNG